MLLKPLGTLNGIRWCDSTPQSSLRLASSPFRRAIAIAGILPPLKGGGEPPAAVEGFSHEQKQKRFVMEKDYHYTGYHSNLKPIARTLRKNMTRQERHLWYDFLRNYPIHFYRQRVIEHYIVDFYCSSANLVIEVDGSQHYTVEGEEYDRIRTDILKLHQLQVLRFSNWEIDNQFPSVCAKIDAAVKG